MSTHPYERSPHSGAGNCHCGASENSRAHPHAYTQSSKSELCVCAWPAEHQVHFAAAAEDALRAGAGRPYLARTGLDRVSDAVRSARGGDAPAQVTGYA